MEESRSAPGPTHPEEAACPALGGLPVESIRKQLHRILSSDTFIHAERLSRFLRFVVEETLRGTAADLKEYPIGVEVFSKPESFDPRRDPIVRVEARRLRAKLDEYYRSDGRYDDVEIKLPKRRYVPVIRGLDAALPEAAASGAASRRTSIGVVPFASLSGSKVNEYFSLGLTEELTNALAGLPDIRVVCCAASPRRNGLQDVAGGLNLDAVLEGSVRKCGRMLRISIQLLAVSDASVLWSEIYERAGRDVFAVQQEIAGTIAARMRIEFLRPRREVNVQLRAAAASGCA